MGKRENDPGAHSAATGPDIRPRASLPGPPGVRRGGGRRGGGGEAKLRGVAHTAVNTTLLRPQTSVVPHGSSVLPVHMYARGVFLHLYVCECVLFPLHTQTGDS